MIRRVIAALRAATPTARRLADLEREVALMQGQVDFAARRRRGDARLVPLPIGADDARVPGTPSNDAGESSPAGAELALPRPRGGSGAVEKPRAGV